jgi:PTH1 family peptidyl-tRNA hydrolase
MWLVAGLGNPGPKYEHTFHNLGFLTVDRLAESSGIRVTRPEAQALVGKGTVGGSEALLVKPQTFMNLSGPSIKALMSRYDVAPGHLIVVYDELDLPWTSVRIRPKGSAGGHHGIESVIKSTGTQDFPRVRLGIHPGDLVRNGAEYVLSRFGKAQMQELDELLGHAARAVESIIAEGVEMSMTKFNRRARGLNEEDR